MPPAKKDEAAVQAPAAPEEVSRCPVCDRIHAADESDKTCPRCGYREQ